MSERTKKRTLMIVIAIVFSVFISTFNETILNLALSDLMEEFNVNAVTVQWIITAYMLVTSVMVPVTAFLYESIPTKKLFLGAQGLLLAGTALCVISGSMPMLIISRMVQALGTGMMIPIMMNTILLVAPKDKIGSMMALGTCGITLGPALGPAISGVVLNYTNWHIMFAGLFVFILIATILGGIFIENVSSLRKPKLDILSVILSVIGLALFIYGISIIMSNIKLSIACLIVGAIIIAIFTKRQTKLKEPMINLAPFKVKDFNLAVVMVMISMMTSFTMNVIVPIFLEGAKEMSTLVAAAFMLPASIVLAVVTATSGRILDKFGPKILIPLGFLIMLVSLFIMSTIASVSTPTIVILVVFAIIFVGIGLAMSPSQTCAVGRLPKEISPDGVAIMNTFTQIAACIGLSLFSGILTAYQEKAIANGVDVLDAVSSGFTHAVVVAGVIAIVGLIFSIFFVKGKVNNSENYSEEVKCESKD